MIKEAIEKILDLANPEMINVEGRQYSSKVLVPLAHPMVETDKVASLEAFCRMIRDFHDGATVDSVFVQDYLNAVWEDSGSDEWARKQRHARACFSAYQNPFEFDIYQDIEKFIIRLKSFFAPSETRDMIIRLIGNIKAGETKTVSDDGISQSVLTSSGVGLVDREVLPSIIKLSPYRTFRDIPVAESEFVLRLTRGDRDGLPKVALFEVDPVQWQLDYVYKIASYITANVPETVKVYF